MWLYASLTASECGLRNLIILFIIHMVFNLLLYTLMSICDEADVNSRCHTHQKWDYTQIWCGFRILTSSASGRSLRSSFSGSVPYCLLLPRRMSSTIAWLDLREKNRSINQTISFWLSQCMMKNKSLPSQGCVLCIYLYNAGILGPTSY